jgi:hypothetical protein
VCLKCFCRLLRLTKIHFYLSCSLRVGFTYWHFLKVAEIVEYLQFSSKQPSFFCCATKHQNQISKGTSKSLCLSHHRHYQIHTHFPVYFSTILVFKTSVNNADTVNLLSFVCFSSALLNSVQKYDLMCHSLKLISAQSHIVCISCPYRSLY